MSLQKLSLPSLTLCLNEPSTLSRIAMISSSYWATSTLTSPLLLMVELVSGSVPPMLKVGHGGGSTFPPSMHNWAVMEQSLLSYKAEQ
jgi:hypothetical protein